jgi:unsaturated chondroitin disaccharide hydrolase
MMFLSPLALFGARPNERVEAPLAGAVRGTLAAAATQYEWLHANLPKDAKAPRSFEHGKLRMVGDNDWTAGFFSGSLWFLFEATGDARWRVAAAQFTAKLENEQHNRKTHDVGFILNCSYGNALRLTGEARYRQGLLTGAASLSTRFNPIVRSIKSWDRDPKLFTFPVIIDNLMNLELLTSAARLGGEPRWRDIALAHADTALRNHFRADGSSVHVVDYDPDTGRVLRRVTHQGAGDDSAWARGQAWALYGYTMLYRETREERYLTQAEKVAAFILNHPNMPADKIPCWDLDVPFRPDTPRDSSAAAIMSSALLELVGLTHQADAAVRYQAFAAAQLRSLMSSDYLARTGEDGGFLLKHSTGNFPNHSEVDVSINYADYYFLEALLRARASGCM